MHWASGRARGLLHDRADLAAGVRHYLPERPGRPLDALLGGLRELPHRLGVRADRGRRPAAGPARRRAAGANGSSRGAGGPHGRSWPADRATRRRGYAAAPAAGRVGNDSTGRARASEGCGRDRGRHQPPRHRGAGRRRRLRRHDHLAGRWLAADVRPAAERNHRAGHDEHERKADQQRTRRAEPGQVRARDARQSLRQPRRTRNRHFIGTYSPFRNSLPKPS